MRGHNLNARSRLNKRGTWTVGLVCGGIAFCLGMVTTSGHGAADRDLARDAIAELMLCTDALAFKSELIELCADVGMAMVEKLEACQGGTPIVYTH